MTERVTLCPVSSMSSRVHESTVDRRVSVNSEAAREGATTLCLDRHVMTHDEKNRCAKKLAKHACLCEGSSSVVRPCLAHHSLCSASKTQPHSLRRRSSF